MEELLDQQLNLLRRLSELTDRVADEAVLVVERPDHQQGVG